MSSNFYYGIKDAELSYDYTEAEWLTPYEVLNEMRCSFINGLNYDLNSLIFPCELVVCEQPSSTQLADVLLLAKYRNQLGSLKLKSVLLSQLINTVSNSTQQTIRNLLILKLPKDSFQWCNVSNATIIPRFALRAGYDFANRQFSYIGRLKVFVTNGQTIESRFEASLKSSITSLIGTLSHIYEYIPAIVLQIHDLSYLDEKKLLSLANNLNTQFAKSFFSRLKSLSNPATTTTNTTSNKTNVEMSFMSSNYEVLCLKKQPAKLKQLCINKLNELEEVANDYCSGSFKHLPGSIRNLLWPAFLTPGQCLVKNSKMRSANDLYELTLTKLGCLKISKFFEASLGKQQFTFEKNVEMLLISGAGVFIVYDNNQAMRKPKLLYDHANCAESAFVHFDIENMGKNLLKTELFNNCFLLELSDTGRLRVIFSARNNSFFELDLINFNEYFNYKQHVLSKRQNSGTIPYGSVSNENNSAPLKINSFCVNVKLVLTDRGGFMVDLPVRLITAVINVIKSIVNNLFNRFLVHLN